MFYYLRNPNLYRIVAQHFPAQRLAAGEVEVGISTDLEIRTRAN